MPTIGSRPGPEEIGAYLRRARDAARISQPVAAATVGLSESSLRNRERNSLAGDWARDYQYLWELARRSKRAQKIIAEMVGIEQPNIDEEVAEILDSLIELKRRGDKWDAIRKQISGMLDVAGVPLSEPERPSERERPPAAS